MTTHDIFHFLYVAALTPVAIFSMFFLATTLLNLLMDKPCDHRALELKDYPFISVQVPSYNDPVAVRCIEACLLFSYPKEYYEIMILDDSTDKGTAHLLAEFSQRLPGLVRYIHRDNREGYKPGALKAATPHVRGELIVIFDADFVPQVDFLERIAQPFEDPKVAIVQARQGFLNANENLVTRFASYLLSIHHLIYMPIYHRCNTVFFCGTAGALRKRAMEEVGGWNVDSITEDAELSVRLLANGYRSVYLPFETPSEVPVTLKAFLKQQMRWSFGNIRVFCDHAPLILFRKGLSLRQRLPITFKTLAYVVAPAVILMTVAGLLGWVTGNPHPFRIDDLSDFFFKFFITSGFLVMALITLHKRGNMSDFPHLFLAATSLGLVLAGANSVALYRALFRKDKPLFGDQTSWICTPKTGNKHFE
jgi:cellulose synthase/poly-beta-1,6-N-acetylglucosamine synthase-like glycosyltransferase